MNDLKSPRVVTTHRQPLEAEAMANQLRHLGIQAKTTGGEMASAGIDFTGAVSVVVPASQLDDAVAVAAELEHPFDWKSIDSDDAECEIGDDDNFESQVRRVFKSRMWTVVLVAGFVLEVAAMAIIVLRYF